MEACILFCPYKTLPAEKGIISVCWQRMGERGVDLRHGADGPQLSGQCPDRGNQAETLLTPLVNRLDNSICTLDQVSGLDPVRDHPIEDLVTHRCSCACQPCPSRVKEAEQG